MELAKKAIVSNNVSYEDDVLESLIEDPTRSAREIANKLGSYRQRIWRKKRRLEEDNVIWGYTAIVDDNKMNHVLYIVLLKLKPMSSELANLIVQRMIKDKPRRENVRLINSLYLNGEYDWIVMFSAPNHAMARRYYDSLRLSYEEYLIEKPVIVDVNFSVVREGKVNPKIEELHDFVPRL